MKSCDITADALSAGLVNQDPEIKSGVPVFPGTRVPVRTLQDWLEAGESLDVFLDDFSTVSRNQALDVLEFAFARMIGPRDEYEDFVR